MIAIDRVREEKELRGVSKGKSCLTPERERDASRTQPDPLVSQLQCQVSLDNYLHMPGGGEGQERGRAEGPRSQDDYLLELNSIPSISLVIIPFAKAAAAFEVVSSVSKRDRSCSASPSLSLSLSGCLGAAVETMKLLSPSLSVYLFRLIVHQPRLLPRCAKYAHFIDEMGEVVGAGEAEGDGAGRRTQAVPRKCRNVRIVPAYRQLASSSATVVVVVAIRCRCHANLSICLSLASMVLLLLLLLLFPLLLLLPCVHFVS